MNPDISAHWAARSTAALASLGAGAIHVAVVPNHLAVWWASGLFFAVLAAFQILRSPIVLRSGNRALLLLGVIVSAGSITLWASTRVWGQPVGPSAGTPLPVGPSGVLAVVLETVVIASAGWAMRDAGTRRLTGLAALAPLTAAVVGVAALTMPGVSAALVHDHGSHAGADDHHEESGGHEDGDSGHGDHTPAPSVPTPQAPDGHGGGQADRGELSPHPSPKPSRSGGGSSAGGGGGTGSHGHDDHAH